MNIGISSSDNAVALCASCHRAFDCSIDPGWVFFPADLKYFIRFEEHDYNRLLQAAKKGERVSRECPTGQMYREHQGSDGLYKRVFLRPFLSPLTKLPNSDVIGLDGIGCGWIST